MTDDVANTSDRAERHQAALEAARVCVWDWNGTKTRLRIRAHGGAVIREIEGEWQLRDFQSLLNGLSARAIEGALTARQGHISMLIMLADGRRFRMVGTRGEDGHAQGLIFSADVVDETTDRPSIEAVFQPIIRMSDELPVGFEALARWRDDQGRLRPVGEFSVQGHPFAGSQLAIEMLHQASCALASWTQEFPDRQIFVQVNLSGDDLFLPDVIECVETQMRSEDFPSESLRIELTEQAALRDFEAGVSAASALRASGVTLVLDDFGSGHSSLAWLAAIPASAIKLDQALVRMAGTPRADAILTGVCQMAKSLGMTITAEGVEDKAALSFLREIGCDFVQGYAFARPMTRDDATAYLLNS